MPCRQHTDLRTLRTSSRRDRVLDIVAATAIGIWLAAGMFLGWSS